MSDLLTDREQAAITRTAELWAELCAIVDDPSIKEET